MNAITARTPLLLASTLLALTLPVLMACDDDHGDSHGGDAGDGHGHDDGDDNHLDPIGTPSGATCPDGSDLTYESFGKPFVEEYCTRCHSSELTGDARNGATLDHDFDSLDGILAVAEHIDQYAAAGPDATNETMPLNGSKPTKEEREMLGEWIACELEKIYEE